MSKSVTKSNGRYEVRFRWKTYPLEHLPDNWCLAKGRLNTLCRRLDAHPDFRVQLNDVFQQQLGEGIIEKVSMKETPDVKHYIPHQAVLTPGKAITI